MLKATTVLIAVSDGTLLQSLISYAGKNEYSPLGVRSVEEALEALSECHERAILVMDIHLGGDGGFELLKEANKKYPRVPVIVITGNESIDSAMRALKLGAYDYISKHFEPDMFLHSLRMAREKLSLVGEKERAEKKLKGIIQELEMKNEEVEKLSRFKSFMMSMASHDLKTTLTVLTGYHKMLFETLGDRLDDKEKKVVREGEKSLKRASLMIESLLDYHSIEMGTINLRRSLFLIGDVIRECVEFLKPYAEMKEIAMVTRIGGNGLKVYGDRLKVIQILDNLITNSIKFVPPGGEIAISAVSIDEGKVKISVRDNGCGIPEEKISGILSSDPSIFKREGTGIVGLGLSICKRLIEVQEGRLSIRSYPGKGTEISFILPSAES